MNSGMGFAVGRGWGGVSKSLQAQATWLNVEGSALKGLKHLTNAKAPKARKALETSKAQFKVEG